MTKVKDIHSVTQDIYSSMIRGMQKQLIVSGTLTYRPELFSVSLSRDEDGKLEYDCWFYNEREEYEEDELWMFDDVIMYTDEEQAEMDAICQEVIEFPSIKAHLLFLK